MKRSTLMTCFAVIYLLTCSTFAKSESMNCDCGDIRFVPSKDRIKITRSNDVTEQLASSKRTSTEQYERLKKFIANADTVLQRHMNGELYQDQDPSGWEEHNGALIAMPLEQWMKQKGKPDDEIVKKDDRSYSYWQLCPSSKLVSVVESDNATVARYESIIVGRRIRYLTPQKDDQFLFQETGRLFFLDIGLNEQGKVSKFMQTPNAETSRPFHYQVQSLTRRITQTGTLYGNAEQVGTRLNAARKDLAALRQASKICESKNATVREK
jgi:hypothetical protein